MRHLQHNKTCEYCGKHFIATRKDAKFDTPSCKAAFSRYGKMENGGMVEAVTPINKEKKVKETLIVDKNNPVWEKGMCCICEGNESVTKQVTVFKKMGYYNSYICKQHYQVYLRSLGYVE
jgi:hypothetical protein